MLYSAPRTARLGAGMCIVPLRGRRRRPGGACPLPAGRSPSVHRFRAGYPKEPVPWDGGCLHLPVHVHTHGMRTVPCALT